MPKLQQHPKQLRAPKKTAFSFTLEKKHGVYFQVPPLVKNLGPAP